MGKYIVSALFLLLLPIAIFAEGEPVSENSINKIGAFAGRFYALNQDVNDFALGINYQYRPSMQTNFSYGIYYDLFYSEQYNIHNLGLTFTLRQRKESNLFFLLSPGILYFVEKPINEPPHPPNPIDPMTVSYDPFDFDTEYPQFVFRLGIGYELNFSGFFITPLINANISYHVFSINAGVGFGINI